MPVQSEFALFFQSPSINQNSVKHYHFVPVRPSVGTTSVFIFVGVAALMFLTRNRAHLVMRKLMHLRCLCQHSIQILHTYSC